MIALDLTHPLQAPRATAQLTPVGGAGKLWGEAFFASTADPFHFKTSAETETEQRAAKRYSGWCGAI